MSQNSRKKHQHLTQISHLSDDSGSLSITPPPLPKTPAPEVPVKSRAPTSIATSVTPAATFSSATLLHQPPPATSYTMSRPEVHEITDDSPLSETDFMCDTPNNFSYISESEDGDGARFTDITVDHINSATGHKHDDLIAEMGNCYLKTNQLPTTLPITSILSTV